MGEANELNETFDVFFELTEEQRAFFMRLKDINFGFMEFLDLKRFMQCLKDINPQHYDAAMQDIDAMVATKKKEAEDRISYSDILRTLKYFLMRRIDNYGVGILHKTNWLFV